MASSARDPAALAGDADGHDVVAVGVDGRAARGRRRRTTPRARPTARRTGRRAGRDRSWPWRASVPAARRRPSRRDRGGGSVRGTRCDDRPPWSCAPARSPPPPADGSSAPTSPSTGAAIDSRLVRGGELFVADRRRARRPRLRPRPRSPPARPPYARPSGRVARRARDRDRGGRHRVAAAATLGAPRPRPARARPRSSASPARSARPSVKDLLAARPGAPRWRTAASERLVQQRARRAADAAQRGRRHRGRRRRDGGPGHRAHRRAVRHRPADGRRRHRAWPPPTPRCSARSTTSPRPRASWSRRCPAGGTAVLNADDPRVAAMAARTDGRGADLRRRAATCAPRTCALDDELRAGVPPRARRGARPRCALAVAGPPPGRQRARRPRRRRWRARCPLDDVAAGLATARLSPWRMELTHAPARAPGSSTTPTTPTRRRWPPPCGRSPRSPRGRRVAVLGVMAELGPTSDADHRAVGDLAARARHRGRRRRRARLRRRRWSPDVDGAVAALGALGDGDAVLRQGQPGRRPRAGRRRPHLSAAGPDRRPQRSGGSTRPSATAFPSPSTSARWRSVRCAHGLPAHHGRGPRPPGHRSHVVGTRDGRRGTRQHRAPRRRARGVRRGRRRGGAGRGASGRRPRRRRRGRRAAGGRPARR